MLPIPVIQQSGQALDRHLADKETEAEMNRIWASLTAANKELDRIESLEESIKAIARTLEANPALLESAKTFTARLGRQQVEFKMLTEDRSYQELVRCVVVADLAQIVAKQDSTNVIEDSSIKASSTLLQATGNSKNFVRGTTFSGTEGSVRMDGITTKGNIHVTESSVGFGPGSALIFGGDPNLVSGRCPKCNGVVEVDRRKLVGYSAIQCPNCKAILPFNVN